MSDNQEMDMVMSLFLPLGTEFSSSDLAGSHWTSGLPGFRPFFLLTAMLFASSKKKDTVRSSLAG